MEQVVLLDELAIIATLGVLVTVVLSRFKLPTVAGLLLAGALLGPYGFKLVSSVHAIETLSEIGVVLLLFSIGLEFSLERLKDVFRQVAVGGTLQVGLTMLAAAGIAWAVGEPLGRSLFYGFVFALSSTAIGLRALMDNRELDAPHGRFIVGTLIFQDLCVVPMVLIVPLLAANQSGMAVTQLLGMALGKAALVVLAIVLLARFVVPKVLALVDASRSREVFLLAVLSLCIGTAWITSLAGLSLALGAFLGGMVVAGTEYGHRAMGDILPLRDAFVSVFFVSLGMLFDIQVVLAHPFLVLALMVGFLFGKSLIAGLSAMALRFPARVGVLAGVGLGQFGEFGFVLARLAESSGVVTHAALGPPDGRWYRQHVFEPRADAARTAGALDGKASLALGAAVWHPLGQQPRRRRRPACLARARHCGGLRRGWTLGGQRSGRLQHPLRHLGTQRPQRAGWTHGETPYLLW